MTRTAEQDRTFRSGGLVALGWAWMAFAALNFVDLALRGDDLAALTAWAVLLFGCGLAYALSLRPRIVAGADGLRIVNPLRTYVVPWPAVRSIELSGMVEAVTVRTDETEIRAWVLQSTRGRRRRRAGRAGGAKAGASATSHDRAAEIQNRTHTGFVVEQLNELAAEHNRRAAPTPAPTRSAHKAAADPQAASEREPSPEGEPERETAMGDAERPSVAWAPDGVASLALTAAFLLIVLIADALA